MTYLEAKTMRDQIETDMRAADKTLRAIPSYGTGAMGMTPDAVRATPEWKAATANTGATFRKLQDFNRVFVKQFAAEIRAERRNRRAA